MTDRTADFRAAARAYRLSHGVSTSTADITRPIVQRTPFTTASRTVNEALTKLHDTPPDVEQLPQTVALVQQCSTQIDALKAAIRNATGMEAAHRGGVVLALCERLRAVGMIVEKQKEQRRWEAKLAVHRLSAQVPLKAGRGRDASSDAHRGPVQSDADLFDGIDAEEMRAMEMENETLAQELQDELDEVRHVERQMAEISSLMSVFSDKIMEQHTEVEALLEEVVASRTEVQKGNQQLQEATEHSSFFRFFVLCFLIIASLALLFLDWYGA